MATDLFDAAGQRFNVDPNLLRAVFQTESGGSFATPDSSAGAIGGMQVMPQTYATVAQRYGLGSNPRDPVNNVMAGAAVLSENLNQYGDVPSALKAYNAGSPSRWNNPETQAYVGKVAQAYAPLARQSPDAAPPSSSAASSDPFGGDQPSSYKVASADTGTATDALPNPNAPPSRGPFGAASPGNLSDDALHSLLTGGSPAATGSTPSAAPRADTTPTGSASGPLSDDALHSMLTGAPPPAPPASSPPASSSAAGTSNSGPTVALRLPGGDTVQAPWVSPAGSTPAQGNAQPPQDTSGVTTAPDGSIVLPPVKAGTGAPAPSQAAAAPPAANQSPVPSSPAPQALPPVAGQTPPAAAQAALGGLSAQGSGLSPPPSGPPAPSMPPNALAPSPSAGLPQSGFYGGLTTAGEGIANAVNRLGSYVDQNVPALGALDRSALPAIGVDQPAQTVAALTPDIAARDKANQGSLSYAGGKLVGDLAATAPVMVAGGALVGGALDAAPVVSNALAAGSDAVRALPGGNLLAGGVTRAATGAAQGATAAAVTSGQSSEPIGQQVGQGAIFGGALGTAVPSLVNAGRSIVGALKGGQISQETAQLANLARNTYGIPLTAAQISESPAVKYAASTAARVPFSGAAGDAGETQAAFNQAVSRTFGEDATKITPGVMQAARDRLGAQFDQIAGHSFQADDQFVNDLANVETNAQQVLPASEWRPISAQLDNVLGSVDQQGNISGDAYQVLTRQGTPLDRAQSSADPNVRYYAGQVRDALDDALARGIPADQQAALLQARNQWRALKTVEPLVGKSTTGDISPPSLMTPVKSSYGNIAYTGGGQLGDLARIGQLMKEPPSSGTAERGSMLATMAGLGGTAASAVAGITHPAEAGYALGGAVGAAAVARAVNSYLSSPAVANSLVRRGLAGNPGPGMFSNALAGGVLPTSLLAAENAQRNRLASP